MNDLGFVARQAGYGLTKNVAVLVLWAAIGILVAARGFRWELHGAGS